MIPSKSWGGGGGVTEIPITQELRRSCKSAHSRMVLEKSKQDQVKLMSDKNLKRKAKLDEMNTLKKRKVEVTKAIDVLKTSLTSALRLHLVLVAIKHEKMLFKLLPLQRKCRRRNICWKN